MRESGAAEEHEWAFAGNEVDALFAAECDGSGGDGTLAPGTIKPNLGDSGGKALVNDGISFCWSGDDEGGVNWRMKFAKRRVATTAFDLSGGGIDGDDVVAALEEFTH